MSEQPTGELEYRDARQVGVDFPRRTIELIVMPYEEETLVPWQGRMVREVFSRGAFDGLERRANRIRVNRDHDVTRTIGRAVAFYPARDEGLVAEIRIAQTELGTETLHLAQDECLDASAGFLPMPGGERWEGRSLRRIVKAWLGHIALVPDPAYESARVLAVRQKADGGDDGPVQPEPTPNLEQLEIERLRREYAIIDERYSVG
jgi:HK97 family phage prohead protease